MTENIHTFISKQQEVKKQLQKAQDDLLKIHLKEIEKMERKINKEKQRRLKDLKGRIEHVKDIIQYHREEIQYRREEITKHLESVEANEILLDRLMQSNSSFHCKVSELYLDLTLLILLLVLSSSILLCGVPGVKIWYFVFIFK